MKETFIHSKKEDGDFDFHKFKTVYKTRCISDLIKTDLVKTLERKELRALQEQERVLRERKEKNKDSFWQKKRSLAMREQRGNVTFIN